MSDSKAVGKPCTFCNGDGFTAEHGCSPLDTTGEDCAMTCPAQVQCEHCNGTGVEPAPSSDSKGAAIDTLLNQLLYEYNIEIKREGQMTEEEQNVSFDKFLAVQKQAILAILAQEVKRVIGEDDYSHDPRCLTNVGEYCDCGSIANNQLRAEMRRKAGLV